MSVWLEHTELIGRGGFGGGGGGGFHGGGFHGGGFSSHPGGFAIHPGGAGMHPGFHTGAVGGVGHARTGHFTGGLRGTHGRMATRSGGYHFRGSGVGHAGFGRRAGGFRDRFGFGWGFYMPFFWFNIYSLAILAEVALLYNWRRMQDGRYYNNGVYLQPYQMQYALASASAQADEYVNEESSEAEVQGKVRKFLPDSVQRARKLSPEDYNALSAKQ